MSGIDEQTLWECDKCGSKYNSLKIVDEANYILAFVLVDNKPIMYCLSADLKDVEYSHFVHEYISRHVICDICGAWLDKRTKTWEKVRDVLLEGFKNREALIHERN